MTGAWTDQKGAQRRGIHFGGAGTRANAREGMPTAAETTEHEVATRVAATRRANTKASAKGVAYIERVLRGDDA